MGGAATAVVAVTGDVPQIGNDTKETTECGYTATAALWITSKMVCYSFSHITFFIISLSYCGLEKLDLTAFWPNSGPLSTAICQFMLCLI